ncbi:MAG: hypothetical protein M1826_004609 [Phylliscum demangeonii]|nr:MAG: hypothetical protein M1826_004609 [Phylliscum demangeonii]
MPSDELKGPAKPRADHARIRLHITPFDSPLLSATLKPGLAPSADNISFHHLQTFPEATYGFVEVSSAEAAALKKKLHGSILRGRKLRVEEARPRRPWPAEHVDGPNHNPSDRGDRGRGTASSAHHCLEPLVRVGVLLPDRRRVRRGWTVARSSTVALAGAGKTGGSSAKERGDCLFRVRIPRNRKLPKTSSRPDIVVREFTSTMPFSSFLKENNVRSSAKRVAAFVDGVGWVDEDGSVMEPASDRPAAGKPPCMAPPPSAASDAKPASGQREKERRSKRRKPTRASSDATPADEEGQTARPRTTEAANEPGDRVSRPVIASVPAAAEDDDDDEDENEAGKAPQSLKKRRLMERLASGSRSASASASASASTSTSTKAEAARAKRSPTTPVPSLTITIPHPHAGMPLPSRRVSSTSTSEAPKVHPLESIFKRPSQHAAHLAPGAAADAPFTFFEPKHDNSGGVGVGMGVGSQSIPPMTPFTPHDFHQRLLRSAAPTPDTAAPGKRFRFGIAADDDDDDDDVDDDDNDDDDDDVEEPAAADTPDHDDTAATTTTSTMETTKATTGPSGAGKKSFEESFWERRGDTNRAWKRRRRETGKAKRKMENKTSSTSAAA